MRATDSRLRAKALRRSEAVMATDSRLQAKALRRSEAA